MESSWQKLVLLASPDKKITRLVEEEENQDNIRPFLILCENSTFLIQGQSEISNTNLGLD